MPNSISTADLPRPFYSEWPRSKSAAAEALWQWHSALAHPLPVGGDGTASSVEAYFDDETERARNTEPLRTVREGVWRAAYEAADVHDLNVDLLASQVSAARQLQGSVRFPTASDLENFAREWAVPHARLLASLAEIEYSWLMKRIDELARGFFFLARFATLPHDLDNGQLFIPVSDLKQNDVQLSELRSGAVTDGVRRVLWKHSIRIRDAFGQGQPILKDLGLRHRLTLKRWWYGGLELLNEIERRDFDVWSEPIELSAYRKLQVYLLTVFGRSTSA
ncbi:phytoene synthase [Longibacter salinarum]|uniref:Phytoene synthase n=1 Tax=Longibacter salinarum TaxID=1850348 RepID=A0A2A8D2C8_9BACT|nr:squalene/phytoene synthase family protein [Longibacter salinarum]PEN15040.1 phytoene synthase [Longibacter salinarum]